MSAFDRWFAKEWPKVRRHGFMESFTASAWNAALDELEGLADGWDEKFYRKNEMLTIGDCVMQLRNRIEELRDV